MSRRGEPVFETICGCKATGETAKAVFVRLPDRDCEVCVPKSVLSEDSEVQGKGDEGDLIVERWFAEREELL